MSTVQHIFFDGGSVRISGDAGFYNETPEQFHKDWSGEKLPELPKGATERLYIQGRSHAILDRENVLAGGPMPWPLGDQIIKALPKLIAAKAARDPLLSLSPPGDPSLDTIAAINAEINSLKVRVIALEDQLREKNNG